MNDSAKKQPVHNDSEPSQTEFKSLVQRGREGDQEAIGSLLSNYRNYMLLIANQDLDQAVRSKLGASDVVQQSMILAQQNFAQFRGDSENELKAWIRKILQNDLLNVRRHYGTTQQRQVDREIRFQDSKIHHIELLDPNNTPQSEVLLKELAVELERCLDQLSESHRNVIRLRNWQEKSFIEIGEILGCSNDAARKLWFRAFNGLKEIVLKSRPEFASCLIQVSDAQPPDDGGET